MSKSVETRRLYRFENMSKAISPYSNRKRSIKFLRSLAAEIWAEHGRSNCRVPSVQIGEGLVDKHTHISFCDGYSRIELTEAQATACVLIHEITHALGYGNPHGKGFVKKYFQLLVQYGKCDEGELMLDAKLYGIV